MRATVTVVAVRKSGGGNEAAAAALSAVLSDSVLLSTRILIIEETLRQCGWLARRLAELANSPLVNSLWLLTPWILAKARSDAAILMHGNANFILPFLAWMRIRTVVVCDAPRRPLKGISGFVERTRWNCLRHASAVVSTFPFRSAVPTVTIELPLTRNHDDPAAFGRGPVTHLLYVGRLTEEKGIRAFLTLASDMPDLRFIVYGSGPLEPEVRAATRQYAQIEYRGYDPDWIRTSPKDSCLVGCSNVEACWTTGAEALIAGIPLVAVESCTGGPQRYSDMTPMALIVPTLSPPSLRATLAKLNENRSAGAQPVQSLSTRLDRAQIRSAYEELLLRVVSRDNVRKI